MPVSSKATYHSCLQAPLLATILVTLAIGCASPGPPRPPSLKLPQAVTDLTAQRVGGQILLHWTTPSKTTDNLDIQRTIRARICRTDPSSPAVPPKSAQPPAIVTPVPKNPNPPPAAVCTAVLTIPAHPGPGSATETLPPRLLSDPASLLDYRVEILNSANRSAGLSNAAYAAAGAAPPAVAGLRATPTAVGIVLQWTPSTPTDAATTIVLDRVDQTVTASRQLRSDAASNSPPPLQLAGKESPEVHLAAKPTAPANAEPSGTVDTTARFGDIYRYTAQRVRTVTFSGYTLELRSSPSGPIALAYHDTFPPAMPTGLYAVPGQTGTAAPAIAQPPALAPVLAIDLSWEPNTEPDLAGYNVYRRQLPSASRTLLNPTPLPGPAFRDSTATPGRPYAYSITAIDTSGNESKPTPEVQLTIEPVAQQPFPQ